MSNIVPSDGAQRLNDGGEPVRLGEWYWVKRDRNLADEDEEKEFFGCVVRLGSNFAQIENPYESWVRVHLDEFDKLCRREPDPEGVIRGRQEHYRAVVRDRLAEIRKVTARLGLAGQDKLGHVQEAETRALSVLSGADDVKRYEKSLVRAKDEELPALFKQVEEAHGHLAKWMQASALPLKGAVGAMEGCIGEIEDRVFNISLYAGLTEEVVQVGKGAPAGAGERLRIMQRLLYMDEECLLGYRHGGIDFKDIKAFDRWLAKPENRDRALPFQRCMAAFRVRRKEKDRDWGGGLRQLFINIQLGMLDKATFLYIRNGERLYRMNCDLDFGELIFPGRHELDLNRPMMARVSCERIEEIIDTGAYEELLKEVAEKDRKMKEWEKANPGTHWMHRPHELDTWHHRADQYHPFDQSSVYFDEIRGEIARRVKHYNRIALIVQGLFDRSEVLHPHAPVKLWSAEGFAAAVELVYDGSDTLHYGVAPDFEEYRRARNAALAEGSVTVGQDRYWAEKEAARAIARGSVRPDSYEPPERRPHGNPGPGYLARVAQWNARRRAATFRWTRKRQWSTWAHEYGEPVQASIAVPEARLFNATAYVPGDYRQFYADPRTRAQYMQWAELLLASEEFHAGNLKPGPMEDE